MKKLFSLIIPILFFACKNKSPENYISKNLEIQKISDKVYQHISFLDTESFGRVACNGMIVADGSEAILFDTPTNLATSTELINWVENSLNCKITAVLPTHFHSDCLGGIASFHDRNIPSYAHNRTIEYARANGETVPKNGFDTQLELMVGGSKVFAEYFGEGHTRDNIIGYFPQEKVIFGGCLIKSLHARKGYLGDANVKAWSSTVRKLKIKYGEARIIVPGHGNVGGNDLLDYTITLFENN